MSDLDNIYEHSINIKNRIIYLSQIDEQDSVSYKTAPSVVKSIDYLNSMGKSPITLKLISVDGGDVGHGISIYSAIKNSKAKVNIECSGLTASCGTIILQAGVTRKMCSSSFMLVHYGSMSLSSDLISAEYYILGSKKWRAQMVNIYANRCIEGEFFKTRKYSLSKVKNYLNTQMRSKIDWWMDPQEALDYGFIDELI